MRRIRSLAVLLVILLGAGAAGCASRSGPESAGPARARSDPRRLTLAEIQEAMDQNIANMYALLQSRRPQWLQPPSTARGMMGQSYPVQVWLDRVRLGGVEQLRTIPLSSVAMARFLTPSEAQAELGMDNIGGAIYIESTGRNR